MSIDHAVAAFLQGLALLGSGGGGGAPSNIYLQEAATLRAPGSPCPFTPREGWGMHWAAEERVLTYSVPSVPGQGQTGEPAPSPTICYWRVWAMSNDGQDVMINVVPNTRIMTIRVTTSTSTFISSPFVFNNPCDLNLDGNFNILDFHWFLNRPYDYDGSGGPVNVADYMAVLLNCRGK